MSGYCGATDRSRAPAPNDTKSMSVSELQKRIDELEAEVRRLRKLDAGLHRTVLDDMSELVVRWKPDGTRLFVNDAYCRLFNARREELIGTPFWPLISEADRNRVQARIAALSADNPVSLGTHRALGPNGETIYMEWVDRAIYEQGQLVELQSVGRDITNRLELQQQALRVARGDAAARTSASIAHDLSNLLQLIHGVADLLLEETDEPSEEATLLKEGARVGDQLLERLRRVSQNIPELAKLDLDQRVREISTLLMQQAPPDVNIQLRLDSGGVIEGNATQIDQVLHNLVRNSCEALPNGGTVIIETLVAEGEALPASKRLPGSPSCVLLRIADNGPGFDPDVQSRLFEPYVTTKPDAEGLGLATVRAIADGHRATITVDSTPQGTSIELVFPAATHD